MGNTAHLQLVSDSSLLSTAQASVATNSLGLLDLVEIAAAGLTPKTEYRVYLAESNKPPYGKLKQLVVRKANLDGAGIAQAIGPLKSLAPNEGHTTHVDARFLVVTEWNYDSKIVLAETNAIDPH